MTPLMWAVKCRSLNTVILLLQFVADPMASNPQETALIKTIANGLSESQRCLMFYQRQILARENNSLPYE